MAPRFRLFRPDREIDTMHLQVMRDAVSRSRDLLDSPAPGTFAGHKTQEPFPAEDPTQRPDIQNPIRSELQSPKK